MHLTQRLWLPLHPCRPSLPLQGRPPAAQGTTAAPARTSSVKGLTCACRQCLSRPRADKLGVAAQQAHDVTRPADMSAWCVSARGGQGHTPGARGGCHQRLGPKGGHQRCLQARTASVWQGCGQGWTGPPASCSAHPCSPEHTAAPGASACGGRLWSSPSCSRNSQRLTCRVKSSTDKGARCIHPYDKQVQSGWPWSC